MKKLLSRNEKDPTLNIHEVMSFSPKSSKFCEGNSLMQIVRRFI